MEVLADHVGKNLDGSEGPLAAQAIRDRKEPVGEEPDEPQGMKAVLGSIGMIKYAEKWKEYYKKKTAWDKEVNPRLFNLLLDHMTKDFKSLVEGRSKWEKTLWQQDGVELVRIIHALCHLRDDRKPEMPEIVAQDRALFLCTQ